MFDASCNYAAQFIGVGLVLATWLIHQGFEESIQG